MVLMALTMGLVAIAFHRERAFRNFFCAIAMISAFAASVLDVR